MYVEGNVERSKTGTIFKDILYNMWFRIFET